MAYKERNVYVEELTKEQVEALPEYNENLTIASD
jgi:stress response protein YsnF